MSLIKRGYVNVFNHVFYRRKLLTCEHCFTHDRERIVIIMRSHTAPNPERIVELYPFKFEPEPMQRHGLV